MHYFLKRNARALLAILAGVSMAAGAAENNHFQLHCGEVVIAIGSGSSPRWKLQGNLRPMHRGSLRLNAEYNLAEGCLSGRFSVDIYRHILHDRFQTRPDMPESVNTLEAERHTGY